MKYLSTSALLFLVVSGLNRNEYGMGNEHIKVSHSLWLYVVLVGLVIIVAVIIFFKRSLKTSKPDLSSQAYQILTDRYRLGEISKNDYAEISNRIVLDHNNDAIEKEKLRLAKGEITIAEFDDLFDRLIEKW